MKSRTPSTGRMSRTKSCFDQRLEVPVTGKLPLDARRGHLQRVAADGIGGVQRLFHGTGKCFAGIDINAALFINIVAQIPAAAFS